MLGISVGFAVMMLLTGMGLAVAGNVMLVSFALYAGAFSGMEPAFVRFFESLSLLLAIPAVTYGAWPFYRGALAGLSADSAPGMALAYEPVWAIGTGLTATPDQAEEVHALIRACLGDLCGAAAEEVRIQYGGSVKPDNAADLFAKPNIDGGLIGGASLQADSFAAIVSA